MSACSRTVCGTGEVQRLLEIGSAMVEDHRKPDGKGWAVLADPEDNEFCLLRSKAERGF